MFVILFVIIFCGTYSNAWIFTKVVTCSEDGTIYNNGTTSEQRSNAMGDGIVVGTNHMNLEMRSLIRFDVSGLEGKIVGCNLQVTVRNTRDETPLDIEIHPLSKKFGQGNSSATYSPYEGVPSQQGDTSWCYAVYNTDKWDNCGGDYVMSNVSTMTISWYGTYEFTSNELLSEVMVWSISPDRNFGWIFKVTDTYKVGITKEFFSCFAPVPDIYKPRLVIQYDAPIPWWSWLIIAIIAVPVLILSGYFIKRLYLYGRSIMLSHSYITVRDIESITNQKPTLDSILYDSSIRVIPKQDIIEGELLGTGGAGAVYKATLRSTGQYVAIKRLHFKSTQNTSKSSDGWILELENLTREIKIMSTIAHPNILPLIGISYEENKWDSGSDHGEAKSDMSITNIKIRDIILIMDFMAQGSLATLLFKQRRVFTNPEKIKIASEIAYGMHHLHSIRPRIIHRDLKSDNVLIAEDGTAKIADFGLSRLVQKYSKTMTTSGTPHYLAPECIQSGKFSEKSDVYSFGIILWEIYVGKRPYQNKNAYKIMWDVVNKNLRPSIPEKCPVGYQRLIVECVSKDPDRRPTFKSIIEKLHNLKEVMCTYNNNL